MDGRVRTIRYLVVRYLISSWLQKRTRSGAAVGVFLPILGVAVGVCAFTVVLSVMGGFVANLKARLLSMESHIEVVVADSFGQIEADPKLLDVIRAASPEIVGVAPFQRGDAVLRSEARPSTVTLVGIDPALARASSDLERNVSSKSLDIVSAELQPRNEDGTFPAIIVGQALLRHISAGPGDRLTLVSTVTDEGPGGLAPRQFPVVVGGALQSGNVAFDGKWAVASLDLVNRFFDTEGLWAGVQVRVRDPLAIEPVLEDLDAALESRGLRAKSWMEANSALVRALALERWGMRFVMFMIILVGCFSITITLVLAVRRKSREMAILRSFGFRREDLGILYLVQGAAVGLLGVALGSGVGFAILQFVSSSDLPWLSEYYSGTRLPVLIDWGDIAFVCVGSFVLATVAAVWPAIEVMRIDVVRALADRG